MNTRLYVWCTVIGLLGIAFQTLIKIRTLQKQAQIANHSFRVMDYFYNDWTTVALNIITLTVAIIASDEIIKYKPEVLAYIKWGFFFIGYTGSSLLNYFISKTQNALNEIINIKTNIADDKTNQP